MATAGHFAIQTPRSEAQTLNSINADDLSFPSPEPSFHSPQKQKQQASVPKGFLSRLQQPTGNTPLAEIKNNAFPRRSEFTPMLKSVTKNQFMNKRAFMATPSRLGKSASTSNLPEMSQQDMSHMEDQENSNMVEGVTQGDENLVEMSSASVSGLKIPHRSPGSNDGAALMTLREQEKVIDEIRKENFSLKLKIFFLTDRIGKMAPEHIQAVLKENVEYKVEQATLRNELKKYKRSLLEAEHNVARMAEEIKTTKSASDPSFVCPLEHGMSEEEAAQLRQAQEEAEENRNEVMFAKKEVEDLKRELWEARREKQKLENEGPEDVAALEAQVEELKGANEDLDLENKKLQEEIGQKDDEIDYLQDQLVEEKKKLEEMESRRGHADDDELAQQMEESHREIQSLTKKITEVESQLQHARNEFAIEKDQLQSMAAEHKSAFEKVEADLHQLQSEYESLDRELDHKHEEVESLQRRSGGDDPAEMQELRREIKDLEEEIKQFEVEKADMEEQIQSLQNDANHLIEKDGKIARERAEERKNLQNDIEELQIQLRETITEKEKAVEHYQREAGRMEDQLKDAERQKADLKKQIDNYMNDEHTLTGENAKIQRALREETERHRTEVDSLQKQINQLTSDFKEARSLQTELETEITTLNEELRSAKRVEDSLNNEIQDMREKVFSGGRDSEHLRKLSAENGEFKQQIATLQARVDTLASQRDRLERQLNDTRAETQHFAGLEREFGSIRAERDSLRKSTMAAQINVAKLKAQVNDLTSRDAGYLEHQLQIVTKERDSLEGQVKTLRTQLDETKKQVDIQVTRLRTVERNLLDAREDLERERKHAVDLLAVQNGSPASDRTRRLNGEIRKLEELLQQSRLRQAEFGKINATQLDEINVLNRRIERLEGELEAIQSAHVHSAQNTLTGGLGRDDKGLHKQLTLAKGQLADLKSKLSQQEREFEQRLEEQLAEKEAKYAHLTEENLELKEEVDRLKKRQLEHVQNKVKLEEQIRSLQRQITRLESDLLQPNTNASVGDLQQRLNTVKKELDLVKEDASQKETKYTTQIRRLQNEFDNLQTHSESLARDLHLTKKESSATASLLRRQLAEARDTIKRGPSALTSQAEKKHIAELRGLGKQIRYLKAKMFREETFKLDLQFAKKFFLMQIECYETFNKADLHLLQQMGIYPDPAKRAKRPKLRSVGLMMVAIARMRRLKDDWAEHKKGGRELKESLKRLRLTSGKRGIVV